MTPGILLVDDNAVQAATRKAILSRVGHDVSMAHSATAALEFLRDDTFLESVGLVITDHLMPVMNGPEFVKTLRKMATDLPVLVISGLLDAEPEYEGLDVIFRIKPFAPEQLISLVRFLLDEPMTRTA